MTEIAFHTLRAGRGNRAIARRFGTAAPAMLGTEPYLPEDVPLILHQPDPRGTLGIYLRPMPDNFRFRAKSALLLQ